MFYETHCDKKKWLNIFVNSQDSDHSVHVCSLLVYSSGFIHDVSIKAKSSIKNRMNL